MSREEVSSLRLRTSRRLRALTAGLLACAAVVTAGLVVGAAPAQAALCATKGHAYLTQPGRVYFSGYNGDKSLGVPRIVATQGELFRLGGNGINPFPIYGRADITWRAEKMLGPDPTLDSGQIDFFPGVGSYHSVWAKDNCVVHEEGPFPVTAPPGLYRIWAIYNSGNHPGAGNAVLDEVAHMQVLPGLPPISSASQSTADAVSSTAASESMMSPGYSEPPPGGGGGADPDPDRCESCPPILE
jgi:hypothetical protein